ncbi:hypothetical protein [Rhodococcus globerulus]|uniref:Uncharacterized protein n=1 Tax=Rhodococcus globerulus TaxID=33008 RepID=A0ABU4C3P7_RHOGO|nr:hypothetical protein [Rhodococcus globerulus]MDV6271124.1 hypothetical protein [Rhodococcus globerulus]
MKQLLNRRTAVLAVFTVTTVALLSENFTPTRAAIWGATWAVVATLIVRSEVRHARAAH